MVSTLHPLISLFYFVHLILHLHDSLPTRLPGFENTRVRGQGSVSLRGEGGLRPAAGSPTLHHTGAWLSRSVSAFTGSLIVVWVLPDAVHLGHLSSYLPLAPEQLGFPKQPAPCLSDEGSLSPPSISLSFLWGWRKRYFPSCSKVML